MIDRRFKLKTYKYFNEKFADRVAEFASDENIFSLREEIAILRVIAESILKTCQDSDHMLLRNSRRLLDIFEQIQASIVACHKIENSLGNYLDKATVLALSSQVVAVLSEHVKDPTVLEVVSSKIALSLEHIDVDVS